MVTDFSKERVRGELWAQAVDHRSGFSDAMDGIVIEHMAHLSNAFSLSLEDVPGFCKNTHTVVRRGRLNPHECLLEVREQWQDGKLEGFGSSLQGIELLQLLSREFFERSSNRSFLDIHFFSRQVFELLHGECQRFQAERVTRGKQGRAEGHIVDT